jgi:probable phosphoglycerate mutase
VLFVATAFSVPLGSRHLLTIEDDLLMPSDASEMWPPPVRRRIYLMRHADVSYVEDGRAVVPETVPLTPRGQEQARAAGAVLAGVPFDRVITSGLLRTRATADLILAGRTVPAEDDPRLREIETGKLADLGPGPITPARIRAVILGALPANLAPEHRFLAGETFAVLGRRVQEAWQALLARMDWRTVLVVSHGIVNRVLLSWLLGAPLGAVGKLEQDACCINLVEVDEAGVPLVRLVNFTPANPLKVGMTLSTLEGLARQFLGD